MQEVIKIVSTYEEDYRKKYSVPLTVPLESFLYEDAPQEVIDAYEEMIDDSQDTYEYQ